MGQRTKASREAAAAAAPPPPQKASAPVAPAKAATPAAPKAPPATGAAKKPVAPTRPAAPARPTAPSAPAAPAPEAPAAAGERGYGAPSPFGVSTLQDQPSYVTRRVTRDVSLAVKMPEYEQRLAKVREIRKAQAEAGYRDAGPVPRPGPRPILMSETTLNPNPRGSGRPAMEVRGYAVATSPEDSREFARGAEALGADYRGSLQRLAELDDRRQALEDWKNSIGTPNEDPSLREYRAKLEATPRNYRQKNSKYIVQRLPTPAEVTAQMRADADVYFRQHAKDTRAVNQDLATTIATLKQYGFTDEADIARSFSDSPLNNRELAALVARRAAARASSSEE